MKGSIQVNKGDVDLTVFPKLPIFINDET